MSCYVVYYKHVNLKKDSLMNMGSFLANLLTSSDKPLVKITCLCCESQLDEVDNVIDKDESDCEIVKYDGNI